MASVQAESVSAAQAPPPRLAVVLLRRRAHHVARVCEGEAASGVLEGWVPLG